MARPNQTRIALFISAIKFLQTIHGIYSASSPSCADDCAPFIPGTVAYWPMTLRTKGLDLSGNKNHATFVGLTYTDGPTGEYNGAVHFNGSSNSFAWITNSPSLHVGKYPGFSFSGYIRYLGSQNKTVSLIDWSGDGGYGVFIVVSVQNSQLHLYPSDSVTNHVADFPNHRLVKGAWHFIGMSYDKATGKAMVFMDGKQDVQQLDKDIVAGTGKTREVRLGRDMSWPNFNYNGDMSCMMLFEIALAADDFKRVWNFCRTVNSTQTILPNITVSNIATTSATASWTKSPGAFSGYNITIERKQIGLDQEIVNPQFILSTDTNLKSVLINLVPGATYRIHVWHIQGDTLGRARSSEWFDTKPYPVVESDSIIFSEITATSANVSWKELTGNVVGYFVDIRPTTGGAKAEPSKLPRGSTRTSLKSLFPRSYYTITIRAKIGMKFTTPSTRSFQTPELAPVESESINITMMTATSADVSWEEVTGSVDGYSVAISPTTGGAKVDPSTVPRGSTTASLKNLSPGSYYTIKIRTKIGSKMSLPSMRLFQTLELAPVESESITILMITASSAEVTWEEVNGTFDGYSVDINPTTGGAKANPSTVPRGSTTTSLKNLSPGRFYIITIRTKIGSKMSSPSMQSFQTLDPTNADSPNFPKSIVIALIAVVFCLVVVVVVAIAVVKALTQKRQDFTSGNDRRDDSNITMRSYTPRSHTPDIYTSAFDSRHSTESQRSADSITPLY